MSLPGSLDLPPRPSSHRNSPLSPPIRGLTGPQSPWATQATTHDSRPSDHPFQDPSSSDFPDLGSSMTESKSAPNSNKKKGKKSLFAKQFVSSSSQENPQKESIFLSRVPDELLIHVFAALEPDMIKLCQSVCQRWNRIIRDDGCWRSAFQYYFKMLPIWRLRPASWRSEYLARVAMAKLFQKGKAAIQVDPRIGGLKEIYFDEDDGRTYLGSLEKGIVAICHVATGKIERDTIFASLDAVSSQIGALKVDKSRIAIGLLDGHVRLITSFKDRNNYSVREFEGRHDGPVTAVAWLEGNPSLFLSGGVDGNVRIWDVAKMGCSAILESSKQDTPAITSIHVDRRHVIAGTYAGSVLVWDLDPLAYVTKSSGLGSLKHANETASQELIPTQIPCSRVLKFPGLDKATPIQSLEYNPVQETAFVALKDDSTLYHWNVSQGTLLGTFTQFDPNVTITSCFYSSDPSESDFPSSGCIVLGDSGGTLTILQVQEKSMLLIRRIKDAHDNPISCIKVDSFKTVSVSRDGKVKLWNTMSGSLIRGFNVKNLHRALPPVDTIPFQQNPLVPVEETPTNICMTEQALIVTVGPSLKIWTFEPSSHTTQTKRKKSSQGPKISLPPARSLRTATRSQRSEYMLDLRDAVRKTRQELEVERESRGVNATQIDAINGSDLTRNLTEEDLLSYAMMLSIEEQKGRSGSSSPSPSAWKTLPSPGLQPLRSPLFHSTAIPIHGTTPSSCTSFKLSGTSAGSYGAQNVISTSYGSARSGGGRLSNSYRSSLMDKLENERDWEDDEEKLPQDPDLMHYMSPPSNNRGRDGGDVEDPWLDDFQLTPSIARPATQSSSRGSRKISIGPSSGQAASVSRPSQGQEFQARSSTSAAAEWLKQSPRISHARQGGSNVMVVPRQNQYDEDDELQYVLELSMLEK